MSSDREDSVVNSEGEDVGALDRRLRRGRFRMRFVRVRVLERFDVRLGVILV